MTTSWQYMPAIERHLFSNAIRKLSHKLPAMLASLYICSHAAPKPEHVSGILLLQGGVEAGEGSTAAVSMGTQAQMAASLPGAEGEVMVHKQALPLVVSEVQSNIGVWPLPHKGPHAVLMHDNNAWDVDGCVSVYLAGLAIRLLPRTAVRSCICTWQ